VGTMVYLKLQPYVQSSVMPRVNQKLSFRYFGPYGVLKRIGSVAYRLRLLETSSIHPVVHVSQLKLAAGFKGVVSASLPSPSSQFRLPVKVLSSQMVDHSSAQVLVQLSELPEDLAKDQDKGPGVKQV
jgi:hypothetical protein